MLLFERFLKNRRGSISVMLTVMLLAVMSLNTTLVEIARFKSVERFYKEVEENAAFSVLSKYDRDLFEHYGLLAITESIDEEEFIRYVNENINATLSEAGILDVILSLNEENMSMDKLYDLSQYEVLQSQINEFCAYRAPITMVNEGLNVEEAVKQILEGLEDSFIIVEIFKSIADTVAAMVTAYIALIKFADACYVLRNSKKNYSDSLSAYNNAIESRDSFIANFDPSDYAVQNPPNAADTTNVTVVDPMVEYQNKLSEKCQAVRSKANELSGNISTLQSALAAQHDAYESFMSAYDAVLQASITDVIIATKTSAEGISDEEKRKEITTALDHVAESSEASLGLCSSINNNKEIAKVDELEAKQQRLGNQSGYLQGNEQEIDAVEEIEVMPDVFFDTFLGIVSTTIEDLENMVYAWTELWDSVKTMSEYCTTSFEDMKADEDYNNKIDNSLFKSLPGQVKAGGGMLSVESQFKQNDSELVRLKIEETSEVAAKVNFDTNKINNTDLTPEDLEFVNAVSDTIKAGGKFFESLSAGSIGEQIALAALSALMPALGLLYKLLDILPKLITFLIALSKLIEVSIRTMNPSNLAFLVFSKINPSMYAYGMFSNRTTDVSGDNKLNGASFRGAKDGIELSDNWIFGRDERGDAFDKANVEYILTGDRDEEKNQEMTYNKIFMLRLLCSLPSAVIDFFKLVSTTGIGLIAVILILILELCLLYMEATLDMIFMLYGDKGVKIVKTKGYLQISSLMSDLDGLQEYLEQVAGMMKSVDKSIKNIDNLTSKLTNTDTLLSEEEDSDDAWNLEDHVDGIFRWGYKEHLLLLLLLTIDKETIISRCADLIEMDMRKIKMQGGEEFRLQDMATYIRVVSEAEYTPILPIPSIPGRNNKAITFSSMHYSGY